MTKTNEISITQFMVPIQKVKIAVGPKQYSHDTETVIRVPVSVLGPQRAGTEMGGDLACFFIGCLRSLVVRALERYSKDPGSSPGGDACFSH